MESGATRTNAHTSMPEVRQADIHVHPGPSLPRTACPWEAHGQPAPPPLSPADPASLQARPPSAWGRCQRRGSLRPGSPGPPRSTCKGRLCPSRKQVPVPRAPQAAGTQGDILSPGVPAEPVPAEAGGAGPAPAADPGSGNGGSKGPLASAPPAQSGQCCRPGARARPWVPAEPESRGGLNLGRGAGPPAHRPAGLGQCRRLQTSGATRMAVPQRSGETAPILPPQRGPPQG